MKYNELNLIKLFENENLKQYVSMNYNESDFDLPIFKYDAIEKEMGNKYETYIKIPYEFQKKKESIKDMRFGIMSYIGVSQTSRRSNTLNDYGFTAFYDNSYLYLRYDRDNDMAMLKYNYDNVIILIKELYEIFKTNLEREVRLKKQQIENENRIRDEKNEMLKKGFDDLIL